MKVEELKEIMEELDVIYMDQLYNEIDSMYIDKERRVGIPHHTK